MEEPAFPDKVTYGPVAGHGPQFDILNLIGSQIKTPLGPQVQAGQCVPAMGLGRFERPTSRLSGVRSNQLSYRPFTCKQ